MKKNNFLEQYAKLPNNVSGIRYGIFVGLLLLDIFNMMVTYLFQNIIINDITFSNAISIYVKIMILHNIWAIVLFIFIKKLYKQFYLYTAITFTGSSIYYLILSCFAFSIKYKYIGYFYCAISILIYILVIVFTIINIRTKIKRNAKTSVVNKKNTLIVAFIGAIASMFIPKPKQANTLPVIIVILILSYLLALTSSGFHKYYLIVKQSKLNKK